MEHPIGLTAISAVLPGNVLISAWAANAKKMAMLEYMIRQIGE
jgi:hypothetical protein